MNSWKWLIPFICLSAIPVVAWSQCGTIHTISYDSTLNGTGGTDNPYNLTFPKFDAAMGTLTDVKIVSVLGITYQYDVENTSSTAKVIKLRINRDDEITSSVLADPIDNSYSIPSAPGWISNPLSGSDGVTGSGPDFLSVPQFSLVSNDTIINQSAANPVDFLGSGNISFDYSSSMSLTSTPAGSSSITNTAATDQIKFILQYVYCDNIALTRDLTSFDVSKKEGYVNLHWSVGNPLSHNRYEVEKSVDGKTFETVAKIASSNTANYEYNYIPAPDEKGKLYFRLRLVTGNAAQYSILRSVDGETKTNLPAMRLIPNPSSGAFSISVDRYPDASDWKIEMYNLKGQVIMQKQLTHAVLNRFQVSESLFPGIYFVLVTDKKNNRKFVERLVIN